MGRKINENETEVVLYRNVFDARLNGYSYKDIWIQMTENYGIDISYNGFGSMIRGLNTWKLTYAWVLSEILSIDMTDLFMLIDIDIDVKLKEKEEWQRKYQK